MQHQSNAKLANSTKQTTKRRSEPVQESNEAVGDEPNIGLMPIKEELRVQLEKIDSSPKNDSQYINCLVNHLFTPEELRNGSFGGNRSNFNGKSHSALNTTKLDMIMCMYFSFPTLILKMY